MPLTTQDKIGLYNSGLRWVTLAKDQQTILEAHADEASALKAGGMSYNFIGTIRSDGDILRWNRDRPDLFDFGRWVTVEYTF